MRLNPVFKGELKKCINSKSLLFGVVGYNLLITLVAVFFLYFGTFSSNGMPVFNYKTCDEFFLIVGGMQMGAIIFVMPYLGARSIAIEAEMNTLDMLLTTRLKPYQIVCGKIAHITNVTFMGADSAFPLYMVLLASKGMTMTCLLQLYILLMVSTIYIGSIGMFFSALYKKVKTATLWSYIFTVFVIFGTIIIFNLSSAFHSVVTNSTFSISNIKYNGTYTFFLLNPVATFIHLLPSGGQYFVPVKSSSERLLSHWVELSILCQCLISIVLLAASSYLIYPLREDSMWNIKKRKDTH